MLQQTNLLYLTYSKIAVLIPDSMQLISVIKKLNGNQAKH
jgi:hypothetical protein